MFRFTSPPMPHHITCGEDTYVPGARHPERASIGVFDLLIVTKGCLYMEEEGMTLTIPSGHYAFLRPDRYHRSPMPCTEETHFYWLHFQTLGSWSEVNEQVPFTSPNSNEPFMQIETFVYHIPRIGELRTPETVYSWVRQLMALRHEPSAASSFRQQSIFLDLLLQLQEEGSEAAGDAHLALADEAAAFLRLHYREPISYKELSEQLHFHANYIALCMKKAFGCTPLEYLKRYRIEQAKQLLIHTNEPIGAIAEETGFLTFPYFVRCFGKHTGTRPKAFRQRYR
ncbi:AraC family transcriptional regulator [Paenibacillus sp. OV219]|uniref:helix-turn-helix domain-containing protein n=1 Tax=Paenibacillus sp. OV219 TaxID=1884377 RepID=UPI0008BF0BEA|nr:helix-turn-helix domain-containing protein [Paenibacillus sp. OV219]SEO34882.1 Helix-turn-helix domain-containing protein [Paenibacillus sp. OV219]